MKNIAFALLFFMACNPGPKSGEYYEHRSTGERIKVVSTGSGDFLYSFWVKRIETENKIYMETRGYNAVRIEYDESDSSRDCVSFTVENSITSKVFRSTHKIIPTERFLEDFTPIN